MSREIDTGRQGFPASIGFVRFPRRGATFHLEICGHDVQVYVSEKWTRLRVFVDHVEWKPVTK